MKYNSIIRQYPAYWMCPFFICIGLLFTTIGIAQQDTSSKKSSTPNKKVFYGQASFYSNKFNGRQTANGEIFSQKKLTCASNVVRMGNWVRVTNLRNNKSAIVKVNDRLHPKMKRVVDLTSAAAHKLGFTSAGLTRVRVEILGKKKPVGE